MTTFQSPRSDEPAQYDQIAEWYDGYIRESTLLQQVVAPSVMELAGRLDGQRICDVACGQGDLARRLATAGAIVTGVDISRSMLAIARREESRSPLGVIYAEDDATGLITLADGAFNGAICNMAVTDIERIADLFASVYRIVEPGGWFVLSIPHPCFLAPDSTKQATADGKPGRLIATYKSEGHYRFDSAPGVRGKVGSRHRTISTYLNALTGAGFSLHRAVEPVASTDLPDLPPEFAELPPVLLLRLTKPHSPGEDVDHSDHRPRA